MTTPNLIASCQRIVARHQYEYLAADGHAAADDTGTLMDATSANAVLTCWRGLSEENRTKFINMGDGHPAVVGDIAWKLIARSKK